MPTQTIVLPTSVRFYHRYRQLLARAEDCLPAGIKLEVGQIEIISYAGSDHEAVPFLYCGETCYLLVREIPVGGIVDRLRRFSRLRVVTTVTAEDGTERTLDISRGVPLPRLRLVPTLSANDGR